MRLLRDVEQADVPADYLFARVRSRRAALDVTGQRSWGKSGDPWEVLKGEYVWVYLRLNRRLRRELQPVFEYGELRGIVLCLRYLAVRDRPAVSAVLTTGLLHRQLKQTLLAASGAATAVAALERLLGPDYRFCRGLGEAYLRQGPGGVEQVLAGGFLQQAGSLAKGQPVRSYFRYLIDMRNILSLYKHLRWQLDLAPPLLDGGSLEKRFLLRAWAGRDRELLDRLIQQLSGLDADPEEYGVEELLRQGMTLRLRRGGRDPLQVGLLLDYLWRCHVTARQRGLRLRQDDSQPAGGSSS